MSLVSELIFRQCSGKGISIQAFIIGRERERERERERKSEREREGIFNSQKLNNDKSRCNKK